MSVALDTSVVIRLLTGTPAAQAELAREAIASESEPVTVSDLVVSESYFALRHHYAVTHLAAVRSLASMLHDPRVHGSGIAPVVMSALAKDGGENPRPGVMDRLIQADYRREELELLSFDRDVCRLPHTRLLASGERSPETSR